MDKKKIFVLIPGLGGSKIYCDCDGKSKSHITSKGINYSFETQNIENNDSGHGPRLYPSKFLKFTNMDRHFFSCPKTKTKPLLSHFYVSVYRRLLERIKATETECRIFSYDWRLTPLKNVKRLRYYLDDIVAQSRKTKNVFENLDQLGCELILVGHSLGGLMIRILMEYLRYPTENISKIFICGTPLIGSKNIYDYNCKLNVIRIILHDNNIDHKDIPQPLLISSSDVVKFIQTFPQTALYLIPTHELLKLRFIPNVMLAELSIIHTIHQTLSKFAFPGEMLYTLVFNVSNKKKIKYKIPEDKIQNYTWMIANQNEMKLYWNFNEEAFNMECNREMDSTVVPCTFLPSNCSIIFDYNYLKHSLIMNSAYIGKNIACNLINVEP